MVDRSFRHLWAVQGGQVGFSRLLLNRGADPNIASDDGSTPLIIAVWIGKYEICQLLLDGGADMDLANKNGWTALWMAANTRKFKICQLLIKAGADCRVIEDLIDEVMLWAQRQNDPKMNSIPETLR